MEPVWTKFYNFVPPHLDYPETTLYETFKKSAYKHRYKIAIDYYGASIRYDKLLERTDAVANTLYNLGVRAGDRVGIALPNVPDAAALFYAVNRLGAVSVMIHPLSSTDEIEFYVRENKLTTLFLLDLAYVRHQDMLEKNGVHNAICVSLWDDAPAFKKPFIKRIALKKAKLKKAPDVPLRLAELIRQNDFHNRDLDVPTDAKADAAAILYSGGSSGDPKGIRLSSYNFNALATQVAHQVDDWPETPAMMAILPFFHGFGLGVCMHCALIFGMTSIMVAQFSAAEFVNILKKNKPHVITGVPTLYEALRREKKMKGVDLSFLRGVFCGGDACPPALKKDFDAFLAAHGASVRLKEGYGLTETVTACVVTPPDPCPDKAGAVGVPLPDVYVKICARGSDDELPVGTEGEIVVSSPTVMLGYLHQKDTDAVLYRHADGRLWLRTGDFGKMDADGFLWFTGRIKRIIKVSGFPVYPNQIEACIGSLPEVENCCCIGVPDPYKMHVIKAIVMPRHKPDDPKAFARRVLDHCAANLNPYSRPRRIELVDSLPLTKVGKVDYRAVERAQKNGGNF